MFTWSYVHFLPPTAAADTTTHKSLICLLVPLTYILSFASTLHVAHSVFPILLHSLHRLGTPKHFPFKPHLPHPHMALSALLNKQFTEPLTTTTLKPALTVSCGIISCFLKSAAIASLCPPLAQIQHACPEKLHSYMFPLSWIKPIVIPSFPSADEVILSSYSTITCCYSTYSSCVTKCHSWNKIVLHTGKMFQNVGKSEHMGNWHFGKMLAK